MEQNEVMLLYEGDEWLSTDKLVLMGIFTSKESFMVNAEKLIRQRGRQHVKYYEGQMCKGNDYFDDCKSMSDKINVVVDDILTELCSRGSTYGWEFNYTSQMVNLDELGEIW